MPTPENEECDPENSEVEYWLEQGGIIRGTPNWRLLVQKTPSPEYAKAHVLQYLHEHRAWEKAGDSSREPGTGMLIWRMKKGLEENRPAPPLRCAVCLRLERECRCLTQGHLRQQIPEHLRDIIKS